jgi:hypothetical protein
MFATIDAKAVTPAGARRRRTGEIPAFFAAERVKCSGGIFGGAQLEHNVQSHRFGRPDSKMGPVLID